MRSLRRDCGFTLIEVIVAMVIIAMAATTIVGLMSTVATRSAETMLQTQANDIADTYLREFLVRPFADLSGANDVGARDQFGNPLAGLGGYQVVVTVAPLLVPLGAIPVGQAQLVTVMVTAPTQAVTILHGYKTDHP
jgi:MSHA pilin protein MshD